jgi:hypothetical protein
MQITGWKWVSGDSSFNGNDLIVSKIPPAESEVLTAVAMMSTIFWDVMPYSLVEVHHISEEYTASIFRVDE